MGLVLILLTDAMTQTPGGTITFDKKRYYVNGEETKFADIKTALSSNPASSAEYLKYKANLNVGAPLVIIGSGCLLAGAFINLASSVKQTNDINNGELGNSYPNGLGLVLIGLAVDLTSLAFLFPANKHIKQSINDYNASLKTTGRIQPRLEMVLHPTGAGIRVAF